MSEVRSVAERGDLFGQRVREHWASLLGRRLDVLVAGCAHDEPLALDRIETRVTGADEDHPAIRAVLAERADLVSWSLGDLRSVPLAPRSYDVIQLSFLLERIRHAELVFDRLLQALRPGGLVLLRMRDRGSAYGLLDRLTPSWSRRLLWRLMVTPGTPGPLPTVYEPLTSSDGMHAFCLSRGLLVTDDMRNVSGPARRRRITGAAVAAVARLTNGRYPAGHDEITMVIKKPQHHFARLL
ncbi:methyltransferase domain-containing protein [Nonomuraea phyllanthi]|uniref:Methyltransferase domain-containing protein n=1 Tax=Nonomuraea phyllanthi TaxID=2219224 RepID=A0A5C4VID7_9ACTN|nr:class I SAM-dependent methyltransferase [Nonomuraea phyllanthi]KAB8191127.1 methyltransferase domain-containing protein [Nonomuraea phyllanthi]QFY12813.1 methyltransferase domain-containing protein [Nonomuraea phyllanthi]